MMRSALRSTLQDSMNIVSIDFEAAAEFFGASRRRIGPCCCYRLVHDLTPGAPRHPALPEGRGGNHGRSAL
jgi:hypothetical protein